MQEMGPGVYHFLFLCAIIPVYDSRLIPGDSAMKDNIPESDDQSAVLLPDSEPSENAEENAAVLIVSHETDALKFADHALRMDSGVVTELM